MLTLTAKIRQKFRKKVKALRKEGILPAVLYGPRIKKPLALELGLKEFEKVYQKAGEASIIKLEVLNSKRPPQENIILIKEIQLDPLTDRPLHIDFFEPAPDKKIEAKVPLIFKGESLAVKELGGTLVRNITELEVKTLIQKLPKELVVDISKLVSFEDEILVKDLQVPPGVEVLRQPEEVIAVVTPPTKVEEELQEPIEEKVEEVEKVEEERKEEQIINDKYQNN